MVPRLSPAQLGNIPDEDILTVLQGLFSRSPLEVAQHHSFYKHNQGPTESVLLYVVDLWHLVQNCNFQNLEKLPCDCLVCGLQGEAL